MKVKIKYNDKAAKEIVKNGTALHLPCGCSWVPKDGELGPVHYNPFNDAVLCHMCGEVYESKLSALFEFDDQVKDILGVPNFMCGRLAQTLRDKGHDIPRKAEGEQAYVIYWMLGLYKKHGLDWESEAKKIVKETK